MRTLAVGSLVAAALASSLALAAPPVAPIAPRKPTQAEAIARVGHVHAVVAKLVPAPRGAPKKNAALGDEAVELGAVSSGSINTPCTGGGTASGTYTYTEGADATGSAGSTSVVLTFNNCGGTDGSDTFTGSVSLTISSSPPSNVTTKTFGYSSGAVVITGGAHVGKYEMRGLVVTTATTSSPPDAGSGGLTSPSTVTVLDGPTTIDGHAITFARERVL